MPLLEAEICRIDPFRFNLRELLQQLGRIVLRY